MTCASCGSENDAGRKFCGECGSPLARACPACGAANAPAIKFCGECGAPLQAEAASDEPTPPVPRAERRLVSVLFADLVGFTTASEGRDAEDTRELLSRYFDLARTTIERYGGTVEKFIGDAVMAVWGAPVAQEDDAERAVRAALDLVAAMPLLAPALHARAGVLTGEAAVTVGARDQGMVAGDLVNTASRIQSAAEPGQVLVGQSTRSATEAAIAYEDAVARELKGKAEPVPLSRALRIIAGRKGALRSSALEPPFVGRERELRLVKELFHATADDRRAALVSLVGIAGIGKSRLAWEFEKYIDGLIDDVYWHRGRCLSYGEGVAYWALAEMVRMRAAIAEDEDGGAALGKLRDTLTERVPDPEEREWIEPRLQQLLGLAERTAPDREDLFSAWRLFFERIADSGPVVLVFDDLHWADAALLEFVEYLLDWARSHPIFVLALARPDFGERHAGFGGRVRSATTLALDPLADEPMEALVRGLVPGLPDETRKRIRERADGVPLYAVETVRMLIDRGLVQRDGDAYRVSAPVEALDVPDTLQALIAARLDGLDTAERRAVDHAAVLGRTFSARGLAAVAQLAEGDLVRVLKALVAKEVFEVDTDPRSPERGQYGFVQALVQRVAYETQSRRDRKSRHLAAAEYLATSSGLDPDEIAEVVAAHLLDAHRAAPDDADGPAIKEQARGWLVRAGERAQSLAAAADAQRAFKAAADLEDDPVERARLLERSGEMARTSDRPALAEELLRKAHDLCEGAGATHDRARIAAALARAVWRQGRSEESIALAESAFAVLGNDEPDADVAALTAELGRIHHFAGHRELALERIERALEIAEGLRIAPVLTQALNTKALIINRPHESFALMSEALRIALDHDLVGDALRAYNNLFVILESSDRSEEAWPLVDEALALARRRGDRHWEISFLGAKADELRLAGRWDEYLALVEELLAGVDPVETGRRGDLLLTAARTLIDRGDPEEARRYLALIRDTLDTTDIQVERMLLAKEQYLAQADGRPNDALRPLRRLVESSVELMNAGALAEALLDAATLAMEVGDPGRALVIAEPVDALPEGSHSRMIDSQLFRLRANGAAARGDDGAAGDAFALALANARNLAQAYFLAPVLVDYGRWLVRKGQAEEAAPLLAEARDLFQEMGATAWLERVAHIEAGSSRTLEVAG